MSRDAARAAGAPPPVAPDGRGCSALGYVHVFQPPESHDNIRGLIKKRRGSGSSYMFVKTTKQ